MKDRKKCIYVGLDGLFIFFVGIALIIGFNVLVAYSFSRKPIVVLPMVIWILLHFSSLLLLVFIIIFINRLCNIVSFDDTMVKRRGIFFGFKKEIPISSIQEIKIVSLYRDGTFYVLLDGKSSTEDRIRKNSAVFVPYSEKGESFIKLFYNGFVPPFEEIKR